MIGYHGGKCSLMIVMGLCRYRPMLVHVCFLLCFLSVAVSFLLFYVLIMVNKDEYIDGHSDIIWPFDLEL